MGAVRRIASAQQDNQTANMLYVRVRGTGGGERNRGNLLVSCAGEGGVASRAGARMPLLWRRGQGTGTVPAPDVSRLRGWCS